MIPALGTCVFVIWLYWSLNRSGEPLDNSGDNAHPPTDALERLAALEQRIQALAQQQSTRSSDS